MSAWLNAFFAKRRSTELVVVIGPRVIDDGELAAVRLRDGPIEFGETDFEGSRRCVHDRSRSLLGLIRLNVGFFGMARKRATVC